MMKISEVVEKARARYPKRFAQVPEKLAVALAAATLQEIAQQVNASTDGVVAVQGFGRFAVKQVEAVKDGAKVVHKRVVFRTAPATLKVKSGKAA